MKQIFLSRFWFVWNNQSGTKGFCFLKTQLVDLIWQLLPNISCILILPEYIYPPAHYAITYTEAALLWMHQWCMCMSFQLRNCLIKVTGTRLWYGWLGMQEKPRINKSLLSHCGGRVAVFKKYIYYSCFIPRFFTEVNPHSGILSHTVQQCTVNFFMTFLKISCGQIIPFPFLRNFPCHTSNL